MAALRRPVVTVLAIILVLGSGVSAYRALQVELFPDIDFPLAAVFISYPGAGPETMVEAVTEPIERAVDGIDGVSRIQSTSTDGFASIIVRFVYGTDMAAAEAQLQQAVNDIDFPDGVEEPNAGRFNVDEFPVIQFGATSGRPVTELRDIMRARLLPELRAIDGVREVNVTGDADRSVAVVVDPARLAESGVAVADISTVLRDSDFALPAGVLFDAGGPVFAKSGNAVESVDEIEALVVNASDGSPVRIGDVATVVVGAFGGAEVTRVNGQPGLSVAVLKEAEANTVDVTSAVNGLLEQRLGVPDDVELVVVFDQGPDIERQIETLSREATFGFLFAVSVVFVFLLTIRPNVWRGALNTLRPTVIIGLSIPLSVFTGILLMWSQGMTLNFMTFGGLAISVGRVVDDSIVVLENVYRHIQGGRDRWRAARDATVEVGPAIFASTLTTVVVFLPLAFIQGLVGEFFSPFALTVTFALIASLVVALTAVPVLGAYLLRPGDITAQVGDDDELVVPDTALHRAYGSALAWALRHKVVTLLGAGALTLASLLLILAIPISLFGGGVSGVQVQITAPPGTTQEQLFEEVVEIEERVSEFSDLYTVSIGQPIFAIDGAVDSRTADFFIDYRGDTPEDIANTLREELDRPGRDLTVVEVTDGPAPGGVDIVITGPDYDDIASVTRELSDRIAAMDTIVNLNNTIATERAEATFDVDPEAAARLGLTAREVGQQLGAALIGETATTLTVDGESVNVVVIVNPLLAGNLNAVGNLVIVGPLGSAPLSEIADVVEGEGPSRIARTDGVRSASITAEIIAEDAQAVGIAIDQEIAALDLPPGVEVVSGGVFAEIEEGFHAIFAAMGIGVVLVYLVMVAGLNSLRNPFAIVLTLPLAFIGVFVALAVTDRALGLAAMMGMLLLIGIVVTNAIVLIAFVEQQRARGLSVLDALTTGARVRLRPILMTALTTSFALLPLAALSEGGGGIISAELATVVIGGLMSSTALTLLVLPVVYVLFNESIPRVCARIMRRNPSPVPAADAASASAPAE